MTRRVRWSGLLVSMLVVGSGALRCAAAETSASAACARTEFEAVVDDAGETLRQLTQKHSPAFQAKLRALKDKRGWSHDQFMAEGMRFVRDEKISALEATSGKLLAKINGAGSDAVAAGATECAALATLKADMQNLVAIQIEKWTYMFGNIDAELV